MSKHALEFVETWVSEQIYPEDSPPQIDVSQAKALAASCRAAANAAGISDAEIEEQFDDHSLQVRLRRRLINYRQRMTNAGRDRAEGEVEVRFPGMFQTKTSLRQ
jgi:hypothetical protein